MPLKVPNLAHQAVDGVLNWIYPAVCQICGEERATAAEGYVGAKCWREVRFITTPYCERCGLPYDGAINQTFQCGNCQEMKLYFRSARSAVEANGLLLDVIHRYKYNRALWFEPFLADLLARQASPVLAAEKWDFIVPVPLFPVKEREREFNQAERLANRLGQAAKIPVNTRLVRRVKSTATQTHLTREKRAINVADAFAFSGGRKLNREKIVLVDDVLTTGATTNACAKALRAGGAGKICVWTVARGT